MYVCMYVCMYVDVYCAYVCRPQGRKCRPKVYVGFLWFLPQFQKDFTFKTYLGCNVKFRFLGLGFEVWG